jgi:hypothetical protein
MKRRTSNIAKRSDSRNSTVLNDRLLTHAEAADWLRVSPAWLYASEVPFVRVGRKGRRYDPRELRAYVDAHRSHSVRVPEGSDVADLLSTKLGLRPNGAPL